MKNELIITNEYCSDYDPSKSRNGGSYPVREYDFTFDNKQGKFHDSSCGDFGKRYDVFYNGKQFSVDGVSRNIQIWTDYKITDLQFINAFKKAFGFTIPFYYKGKRTYLNKR